MKQIFFTPGPSQLYPNLKQYISEAIEQQIGSISHRSKQFEEIFSSTISNLKKLLDIPQEYSIFFVGSGTEAMERTIENVVEKHSLHFVNGAFSKRFYETAIELKKQAKKIEVNLGEGFDLSSVILEGVKRPIESPNGRDPIARAASQEASTLGVLQDDTELFCFTHNETSTGVMLPSTDLAKIKKTYPNKLIAIDIVSSAPYAQIDFKHADIVFFSVQKGFGLPSGLGVMIVSPQALEKSLYLQKKGTNIGTYHNFLTLQNSSLKNQTPETPPVLHLYLLNKVLEDMLRIGIDTIRKETDAKATLLYDFFDNHKTWKSFVKDKQFRSPTVIVADVKEDQKKIKDYLKTYGMAVGSGYGKNKDTQIRIANFPAHTTTDIRRLIKILYHFSLSS